VICTSTALASPKEYHRLPKPGHDRHQRQRVEGSPEQSRWPTDAVAKAAEGEIISFTYDFPKPGTKALAPKETLEVRIGKQAWASVISRRRVDGIDQTRPLSCAPYDCRSERFKKHAGA
jgi:hypothetical protein